MLLDVADMRERFDVKLRHVPVRFVVNSEAKRRCPF
jgi:hypothetical protein